MDFKSGIIPLFDRFIKRFEIMALVVVVLFVVGAGVVSMWQNDYWLLRWWFTVKVLQ